MDMPVVLVVEGEALIRISAVHMVRDAGFEAVSASSADEAIRIMEALSDIGAVFTGINMSGSMNGLKLARSIHDRWPPIHLIVASGRDASADKELPENGRFIRKPYTAEQISAVLVELFDLTLKPIRVNSIATHNYTTLS
ncbi:MAG TPA: response regulator [Rhizomicrobium sp.]